MDLWTAVNAGLSVNIVPLDKDEYSGSTDHRIRQYLTTSLVLNTLLVLTTFTKLVHELGIGMFLPICCSLPSML